jgi:hypothetical protein
VERNDRGVLGVARIMSRTWEHLRGSYVRWSFQERKSEDRPQRGLELAEQCKRNIFGKRGGRSVGTDERSKVPTGVFGQGHPGLIIDQAFTTKVLLKPHSTT